MKEAILKELSEKIDRFLFPNKQRYEVLLESVRKDEITINEMVEVFRAKCLESFGNPSIIDPEGISLNVAISSERGTAEGMCDTEPTRTDVTAYLYKRNFSTTNEEVWFDNFQGVWRWSCNIKTLNATISGT